MYSYLVPVQLHTMQCELRSCNLQTAKEEREKTDWAKGPALDKQSVSQDAIRASV